MLTWLWSVLVSVNAVGAGRRGKGFSPTVEGPCGVEGLERERSLPFEGTFWSKLRLRTCLRSFFPLPSFSPVALTGEMGGDGGKTISSSIVIFRVKETDTVASAANSLANVRDFGFVAKTTKKGSDSPRPNVAEVGKVTY
jgi:hypothetical protein